MGGANLPIRRDPRNVPVDSAGISIGARMPVVEANPENWVSVVQGAAPGMTVRLAPGRYGAGEIHGLRGKADAPITLAGAAESGFGIDSAGGSRFDGGTAFETFRGRVEAESDKLIRAENTPASTRWQARQRCGYATAST
ncbi:MAG: hypothetical protein IPK81_16540 [Rhodospirillales bacterium]|nr:MAG: hypothetical protein IPK81_16540 [Rhodospirillales bacterium]